MEQNSVIWNITGMSLNICWHLQEDQHPEAVLFFSLLHPQIKYPAKGKGGPGL